MVVILFVGILSLLVLLYVFEQYRTRRLRSMMKDIPGMKCYPLVGSALEFGNNSVAYWTNLVNAVNTYGPIFHLWMGPTLYVALSDPKDVEMILSSTSHLYKSSIYTYLKDWLGFGLITSPVPKWRGSRKTLTPAFHFKILESYIDIMNDNTKIMMELLEKEVGKEKFDIGPYIDKCTLDIICETAMATSVNAQLNEESKFPKSLKVVSNAILERAFKPWLFPDFTFKLSSSGRLFYKHLNYINYFIDSVIVQKKKNLELKKTSSPSFIEGGQQTEENGIYYSKKRPVFLDLLLSYAEDPSNQLTDRDIRDEVNTFMFAGHDTTASTIGFIVYLLGKHPEIQEKVLEEVNTVFSESGKDQGDYYKLMNLKYLDQVIKESLRLYPAVPYIGRKLFEDVTLPSGHTIPAGAELLIAIFRVQRNPEIFPNPEEFNPDNFSPVNTAGRHSFNHIPFSAGPRNCIGQKFAILEIKITVVKLLQTFKIKTIPPEPLLASELVLRSTSGINIRLEKRS